MDRLAVRLRQEGIRIELEPRSLNGFVAYSRTKLLIMRIRNLISTLRPTALAAGAAQVPIGTQSSSSTSLPFTRAPGATATTGQSTLTRLPALQQPTGSAGGTALSTIGQPTPASPNVRDDYMLLCSDDKGWLTNRYDLKVSQIRSDRELFDVFRFRLYQSKNWVRRICSLKSIQRISFVKVRRPSSIFRPHG